ncbi:MAG: polysaccharide deacetylase family protein, partial [Myxococcota bacterium]
MTSLKRIAAVSVDLDEIPRYCEIHDLPHPSGSARNAVYRKALPRFLRLFAEEHISCTLFAVGGDLEDEANRVLLAEAVSQGHEIGNHSFHHYYDMTRRDATCLLEEIERGSEQIES